MDDVWTGITTWLARCAIIKIFKPLSLLKFCKYGLV